MLAKAAFHIHKNCGFPFPAHIRKHNRLTLGYNCVLDSTWTRFSFRFTSTFSLSSPSTSLLLFLFFLLFVVRELFWKLKYVCTFRPKAAAEIVSKGSGKLGMAIRVGVMPHAGCVQPAWQCSSSSNSRRVTCVESMGTQQKHFVKT